MFFRDICTGENIVILCVVFLAVTACVFAVLSAKRGVVNCNEGTPCPPPPPPTPVPPPAVAPPPAPCPPAKNVKCGGGFSGSSKKKNDCESDSDSECFQPVVPPLPVPCPKKTNCVSSLSSSQKESDCNSCFDVVGPNYCEPKGKSTLFLTAIVIIIATLVGIGIIAYIRSCRQPSGVQVSYLHVNRPEPLPPPGSKAIGATCERGGCGFPGVRSQTVMTRTLTSDASTLPGVSAPPRPIGGLTLDPTVRENTSSTYDAGRRLRSVIEASR